jgi:RNA polymerase sigma-70 factor (ECF subfamily)
LGISEQAARQAASRLRKRYRELLREEVSQTVAEPGDIDDEIRSLFAAFG